MSLNQATKAKADAIMKLLRKGIRGYFTEVDNQRDFEAWYKEKYGEEYQWKKVSDWLAEQGYCGDAAG